jgi:hypothetical protein
MDRVLPSEGRGCWFDPSRARHLAACATDNPYSLRRARHCRYKRSSSRSDPIVTTSTSPDPRKHERRHLRYTVSWSATLQTPSGRALPLRVIDIGHGGIGVLSDDMLPVPGVFAVTLRVPVPGIPGQHSSVNLNARVIHQLFAGGANRAGLSFVDVAPAVVELLIRSAQKRI